MFITESFLEYPDNISNAVLCFFKGCLYNCQGCSNPQLKKWEQESNIDVYNQIIEYARTINSNKIVFVGGDCLHPQNIKMTEYLLDKLNLGYDICIYTGASIENVPEIIVKQCKFLKCGKYDENCRQESYKNDSYIQFASKNQKLYSAEGKLLSENGRYYFIKEDTNNE